MLMVTLVLVLYHFIALCFCTGRRLTRIGRANESDVPGGCMIANTHTARMISENIPAHKYRKAEMSGNLVGEEGMCAVCLGDFEEGEDLRTLPGCLHSFHVSCIDKWLLSHANCPICRADQFPN